MERGGKGSFQAFKLQRHARTTVCSHSAKDMAATFHSIQHHPDDIQDECLSCCEHLRMASFSLVKSGVITKNFRRVRCSIALISIGVFAVPPGIGAADLSAAGRQGSKQPSNTTPHDPNNPNDPPNNPNPPSGPVPTAPSGPGGTRAAELNKLSARAGSR